MSIPSSSERNSAFRNEKPRPDYVPGVVVCRVAEDTVANVVDMDATPRASVRAARMPEAIYRPLQRLITSRQIQDAEPLFSRRPEHHERPTMRSLDLPSSAAVAQVFAASVRDSESEQLRGLVVLRVAKNADPQALAKDLQAADGIDYAHAVPARWPQAGRTRKTGPDPFLKSTMGPSRGQVFRDQDPGRQAGPRSRPRHGNRPVTS